MAKKPVKTPKKAPKKKAAVKEKPVKPIKLDRSLIDPLRLAAKTSAAKRLSK